jgi:glycosyltransferase involved in cell wall biosynthesis
MIRQAQLLDCVHLLGERPDVTQLNAALDIASNTSLSENFPNAVGEAMACGTPCVVTDVGDSSDIVSDTGLVVPPQDPSALAKAWSQLISAGASGRQTLGQAARQRIIEHFSLEAIVGQYQQFYTQIIQQRGERKCVEL